MELFAATSNWWGGLPCTSSFGSQTQPGFRGAQPKLYIENVYGICVEKCWKNRWFILGCPLPSGQWRFVGISEPKHVKTLVVTGILGRGDNRRFIQNAPKKIQKFLSKDFYPNSSRHEHFPSKNFRTVLGRFRELGYRWGRVLEDSDPNPTIPTPT